MTSSGIVTFIFFILDGVVGLVDSLWSFLFTTIDLNSYLGWLNWIPGVSIDFPNITVYSLLLGSGLVFLLVIVLVKAVIPTF